jgi:hypothetical protein
VSYVCSVLFVFQNTEDKLLEQRIDIPFLVKFEKSATDELLCVITGFFLNCGLQIYVYFV